jgi:excisionase family DNA binding protein
MKKESKMALKSPAIPVLSPPNPEIVPVTDPPVADLPTKNLLRVSEAAQYFGVHERTIRLWIEHGHLIAEGPKFSTVFISRESIKNFRLMKRRVVDDIA